MLALRDLGCTRSGRRLFNGVSCTVPAGQLLRVQGANGAGKTSLLRIICGLLEPTSGEALWHGQGVTGLREEFGRELIYLGHAAALKDDLSPLENLQAAHAQRITVRRHHTVHARAAQAAGCSQWRQAHARAAEFRLRSVPPMRGKP